QDPSSRDVLAFRFNSLGVVMPIILMTALTLNVVALTVPFMEMQVYTKPSESYSIPRTVQLMWEFKLYWVAILVVGFSLVFPFFKLGSLFCLWYIPLNSAFRRRCLEILGGLGRWSLLDVFVALLFIVLSHDQGRRFETETKLGLPLFLAAICLSMIASEIMHRLQVSSDPEPPIVKTGPVRPADGSGWRKFAVPVLIGLSLASLVAALSLPYIKITQIFLDKNSYSILDTVLALWEDKRALFSLLVLAILIIAPVLRLVAITLLWYRRVEPKNFRKNEQVFRGVGHWAMLDVFGLALLLFLLEGGKVIKIEGTFGVWAMLVAIVLNLVLGFIAGQVIRSRLNEMAGQKLPG
ncbi:MAG: paraquat-inducible protein A, partial [Phycisphaerales bacterium]|nr:paraquat-inducible protein A [Phycisphaerales bacterium]